MASVAGRSTVENLGLARAAMTRSVLYGFLVIRRKGLHKFQEGVLGQ